MPQLVLLNAAQTYRQTLVAAIQAQSVRFADAAALFQALGDSWWNRHDTVVSENANAK